ncbi:MAG: tyrosine-protein phosphatase, partial [Clostridia bacterium]|nr:tyrosine-protein phosphatase [Clostridia bacterium]
MTKQINYKVLLLLAILTLSSLLPAFETAVYAQPDGNMYFITDPVDDYFEPHTDLQLSYLSSPHNTATSFAKGKEHLSEPKPLHLSWNTVCDASLDLPAEYTVELSESPEFDNVRSIVVTEPCADIYNLMTATRYYWRVTATVNGVRYCGETNTFTTSDLLPRNLAVDGITNVRDLGGWKTMDGGKVRQGLMYRCSKLNDSESTVQLISQKGIDTMRSDLGIRSEIELRRQDEYGGLTNSVLGDDINYYLCHMSSGGDIITSNYASLRSLFYILSDINNYPLIFHCSIGTDRTGMVAYIVNGLLGVSENYLMRDYLFSNFGNIGGSRKVTTISGKYPKIFKQYKGATLSEKIRNYLIEKAGVAPWEIDAVISIMKEPAPEYSIKGEPIYSEQDYLSMSPDGEYYLAEDISVASSYPQAFFGKIDGCGHTVTTSVPLFEICDGTIENLNIEGVISSSACAGALASDTNGITLRNVNNYAHVFSSSSAGGLIARSSGGNTDIFDCANYGRITGGDHSGGLFGDCGSELTIKDCENHGRVVSDGYAGGICGNVSGSIFAENVYNFGNVKGYSLYSGGLFGSAGTKSIFKTLTACGNYGSVSGCDYAAGIFGYVMANSRTAQLSYVYNTGDITATAQSAVAAGLVSDYESGTLGLVACYNAGEITADGDLYSAEVELFYNKDDNFDEGYIYSNYCRTSDPAYRYYDSTNDADIFVFADGTDTMALPYAEEDLAGGALCSMLNSIHFHSDMYKQVNGYPATTESVKTQTTEPEICAEKIGGYKVRLNWLDPELTYVIRYATGEYADISSVKKG